MKQTVLAFSAILLLLLLSSCSGDDPDGHKATFEVPELTAGNTVQFTVNAPGKLYCEVFAGGTETAIDWGDGTLDKLAPADNEHCRHMYKKRGNYRVKIWSDNLTFLNVSALGLPYTALSIGYCPELTYLGINSFGDITQLTLADCPKLENLNIGNWQNLESLDISKCTSLKSLSCYTHPRLKQLDVSNNERLERLDISYLPVSSLDLSANTNLQYLFCSNIRIRELSVKKNARLRELVCFQNEMTALELGELKDCYLLYCLKNELPALDISGLPGLQKLCCRENKLATLDTGNNPALAELSCEHNELTEIILQDSARIEKFYCSSNRLQAGELNKIFTALSESKVKAVTRTSPLPSPQPNIIQYNYNPGADDCNSKIITGKGWLISEESISEEN